MDNSYLSTRDIMNCCMFNCKKKNYYMITTPYAKIIVDVLHLALQHFFIYHSSLRAKSSKSQKVLQRTVQSISKACICESIHLLSI